VKSRLSALQGQPHAGFVPNPTKPAPCVANGTGPAPFVSGLQPLRAQRAGGTFIADRRFQDTGHPAALNPAQEPP